MIFHGHLICADNIIKAKATIKIKGKVAA